MINDRWSPSTDDGDGEAVETESSSSMEDIGRPGQRASATQGGPCVLLFFSFLSLLSNPDDNSGRFPTENLAAGVGWESISNPKTFPFAGSLLSSSRPIGPIQNKSREREAFSSSSSTQLRLPNTK